MPSTEHHHARRWREPGLEPATPRPRKPSGIYARSLPPDLVAALSAATAAPLVLPVDADEHEELTTKVDLPTEPVEPPEWTDDRTLVDTPPFSDDPDDVTERVEVAVALQSESALWEGLDGELGVFWATYEERALGTPAQLTVHLTGETSFTVRATLVWTRSAPGVWPGHGFRIDAPTPDVWFRMQRFARRRAPLFHA
ncbi:MAG: hypothetical protein KF901_03310 [Myxococcales bacterium]|nr:hypothetical protein [Myxococcales bacterium]